MPACLKSISEIDLERDEMKSYHINAYVFNADIQCCDCVAEWAFNELIEEGYTKGDIESIVRNVGLEYDAGVYGYRSEILLRKLSELWQIDLENEYSWDSDDFPKVVFADQIEETEYCGICHEELP